MSSQNHISINETILMAFINGELTIEQSASVEAWLDQSPKNKAVFDSLKKAWELSGELKVKPVTVDTDAAWLKVKANIADTKVIPITKKSNPILKYVIGIAATLTLVLLAYTFWQKPIDSVELMATNNIINQTLPDGSDIVINKNSQLTYPETFNDNERRVKLKGEAFFDIKRDESQPFVIDLPNEFYVKVLGTSFTINTDKNNTTTVYVKTGKVEFGNTSEKLILVANEKAIYNQETKRFEKTETKVEKVEELYWIDEQLVFEGERLVDILDVLSDVFDTEIELMCDMAADYPIVSDHNHENLESILEVICLVHDLKLVKKGVRNKEQYIINCND
ncbi:MAG: FecR domain-containing protein [Crocinitomicaceae bacterium]